MATKKTKKKAARKSSVKKAPAKKKSSKKSVSKKKQVKAKSKKKASKAKAKKASPKASKKKAAAKKKSVKKKAAKKSVAKKKGAKKAVKKKTAVQKKKASAPKKKVNSKSKASPKKAKAKKGKEKVVLKPKKASPKEKPKAPAAQKTTLGKVMKKVMSKPSVQKKLQAVKSDPLLGKKAPQFTLNDNRGREQKLTNLSSAFVVLFFYPKDDTPGCTLEAKGFTKDMRHFKKLDCAVFGVSGGDEETKDRFCKKHGLKIPLLADKTFSVSKKYGAYGEKSFMGRKYMGILRKTVILDKSHKVIKVYEKVKPEGHSTEVYKFIADFKKNGG